MVKNSISVELPTEASCRCHIEKVSQLFQELHSSYMKPFKDHMQNIAKQSTVSEGDAQISENILGSGMALSEAIFMGILARMIFNAGILLLKDMRTIMNGYGAKKALILQLRLQSVEN